MVEFLIDQALREAIDLHNRNQLDDAKSLYNKIISAALGQIEDLIFEIKNNKLVRVKQNDSNTNTWRKRTKVDGLIDWRMGADNINNLTASAPYIFIIFSGSIVFFFDFDIDSEGPTITFFSELLFR